ncbi:hypothetical protein A2V94_07065 [Candidatus Atribacteria bacterium RBG_16_35_8]|nr:MAG: hypothetical protein A2V94_07065 [Candidatus Atribacteria bacterium RBG_16_35_8]
MTEVLIGDSTVTPGGLYTYNWHFISKAICLETGIIKSLHYYGGGSGYGKINIYDADINIEENLLWANNTSQAITGGQWNSFPTDDILVIKNNYYWIGAIASEPVEARWISGHSNFTGLVLRRGYAYDTYEAINLVVGGYASAGTSPICCYATGDIPYSNPLLMCTI